MMKNMCVNENGKKIYYFYHVNKCFCYQRRVKGDHCECEDG